MVAGSAFAAAQATSMAGLSTAVSAAVGTVIGAATTVGVAVTENKEEGEKK